MVNFRPCTSKPDALATSRWPSSSAAANAANTFGQRAGKWLNRGLVGLPMVGTATLAAGDVAPQSEERNLEIRKGIDALLTAFEKQGIALVVDPKRRNVAAIPS